MFSWYPLVLFYIKLYYFRVTGKIIIHCMGEKFFNKVKLHCFANSMCVSALTRSHQHTHRQQHTYTVLSSWKFTKKDVKPNLNQSIKTFSKFAFFGYSENEEESNCISFSNYWSKVFLSPIIGLNFLNI